AATSKPDSVIIAEAEPENLNCNPISGRNNQKYKAALLLPFYLQGNEQYYPSDRNNRMLVSKIERGKLSQLLHSGGTDTIASKSTAKIDPRAESFIEFYEGVLLAIDSLQQKGMNIELYVFDATNQKMINALLQLDEFRDLDLIIGPVHPEIQESVAAFAAKNRIPMISPLASTGDFENNNSWYFKVNPTREYQIEQTAQYIADEFRNKNFVLLPMGGGSNSTEAKLAELGKTKLIAARQSSNNRGNLFHEYSFQTNGLNGVKPLLDENGENIFIIPTDNEAQVSVAVTNLNAIAEKFNVVLIGTSNLIKLKSIQTENYHHIRLRYLSATFIDYTKPLVRRFVSHYRSTFSAEPSQFSHQGFDVSYYFLSALFQYGKDFRGCLPDYPMELTQTVFNFRKVAPMGGFMNHGMFVTAFERNYDILNYGTVGTTKKVISYQ
ncbi:MAG: ABC transporter substrate-binding protein, partial [Bacteroidota bacterium]|nr:ABC transporter substrate-binding protein [Bacteroidota bacterium]